MSKQPFSIAQWTAMRAQIAGYLARGEIDHDDGRNALATIDGQIARMRKAAAAPNNAGAFRIAPRSASARPGYYAFLDRFARRAATDVGGGLVTETDGVMELRLYGAIGAGFGIAPTDVARALDEHQVQRVRLNSPGGDVFDGIAIANTIAQAGLPVIVDGVAASIASVIAASSPKVTMMEGAHMMIHRAWSAPVGNGDDLRKEAGVLDKLDDSMSRIYAKKANRPKATPHYWLARMGVETWFTADEAVAAGLADTHMDTVASGIAAAQAFDMATYHSRVPKAFRVETT